MATCITNNDGGNCAIGEDQISAELSDLGGGMAYLEITNAGPEPSVITQVLVESSSVLGGAFLSSTADGDVFFSGDFSRGDLTGGDDPDVLFATDESLSAARPALLYGIGPDPQDPNATQSGRFRLLYDGSFEGLAADVRIGVHVVGFADGGSESFVTGEVPMPEPSAALLFAVGGAVFAGANRRHRS